MTQDILSVIASFFGSLGFAILYNTRGRRIWIPAVGGAVFWAVYLIFFAFCNIFCYNVKVEMESYYE